jgi:hypothetical protein
MRIGSGSRSGRRVGEERGAGNAAAERLAQSVTGESKGRGIVPIRRCPLCGKVGICSLFGGACEECEAKETPEEQEERLYRDSRAGLIRPGSLCYRPKRREKAK